MRGVRGCTHTWRSPPCDVESVEWRKYNRPAHISAGPSTCGPRTALFVFTGAFIATWQSISTSDSESLYLRDDTLAHRVSKWSRHRFARLHTVEGA